MKWPRREQITLHPLDEPTVLPKGDWTDAFPAPPTKPVGADDPLPEIPAALLGHPKAPRGATGWPPSRLPRRFLLMRHEDHSGVSGTGVVAEGIAFTDGVVSLRWIVPEGNPGHGYPTSVVFHDEGVASVTRIHGHGGSTKVIWLD